MNEARGLGLSSEELEASSQLYHRCLLWKCGEIDKFQQAIIMPWLALLWDFLFMDHDSTNLDKM